MLDMDLSFTWKYWAYHYTTTRCGLGISLFGYPSQILLTLIALMAQHKNAPCIGSKFYKKVRRANRLIRRVIYMLLGEML